MIPKTVSSGKDQGREKGKGEFAAIRQNTSADGSCEAKHLSDLVWEPLTKETHKTPRARAKIKKISQEQKTVRVVSKSPVCSGEGGGVGVWGIRVGSKRRKRNARGRRSRKEKTEG